MSRGGARAGAGRKPVPVGTVSEWRDGRTFVKTPQGWRCHDAEAVANQTDRVTNQSGGEAA